MEGGKEGGKEGRKQKKRNHTSNKMLLRRVKNWLDIINLMIEREVEKEEKEKEEEVYINFPGSLVSYDLYVI